MNWSEVTPIIQKLQSHPSDSIRWVDNKQSFLKVNNDCVPGMYIKRFGFYVIGSIEHGDAITIYDQDSKVRLASHDDFYEDTIVLGLTSDHEQVTYSLENVTKAQKIIADSPDDFLHRDLGALEDLLK